MISNVVHSTEEQPCPACGHMLDSVSAINPEDDGELPAEGDISICIGCGSILAIGPNLEYLIPSAEFLKDVDDSTMGELTEIQELIRSVAISGHLC